MKTATEILDDWRAQYPAGRQLPPEPPIESPRWLEEMRTEWDPSSRELARAHVELLAQHGWKTARERAYEAYRMHRSVAGAPVVLHGQRLLDVDRPAAPEPTPRPALPMAEPVLSYEALQAMAAEATAKLGRACR